MPLTKVIAELCDVGLWLIMAGLVWVAAASQPLNVGPVVAVLIVAVIRKLDRIETAMTKPKSTDEPN